MYRQYLAWPACGAGMQKCGGISATAKGNGERQAGFEGCNRRV
jgi:hypothetical protein